MRRRDLFKGLLAMAVVPFVPALKIEPAKPKVTKYVMGFDYGLDRDVTILAAIRDDGTMHVISEDVREAAEALARRRHGEYVAELLA